MSASVSPSNRSDRPTNKISATYQKLLKSLITRLTEGPVVRGRLAQIEEAEVLRLANECATLFMKEPACLDLDLHEPLYIVGDLFGQHSNLVQIFAKLGPPPQKRYLFLGNYVDRGDRAIELVSLLFAYKVLYPDRIFMLRGNHECMYVSLHYGFSFECRQRQFLKTWIAFMNTFDCLPAVAIVENSVFCTHSGIIHDIPYSFVSSVSHLKEFFKVWIPRPTQLTNNKIWTELTWSEPQIDSRFWQLNPAGQGYLFPEEAVVKFCERFGLQQVIRSHDLIKRGYEFAASSKLLTLFSMPQTARQCRNMGALVQLHKRSLDEVIYGRIFTLKLIPLLRRSRTGMMALSIDDLFVRGSDEQLDKSGESFVDEQVGENSMQHDSQDEIMDSNLVAFDLQSIGLDYEERVSLGSLGNIGIRVNAETRKDF
ncbi:unnamed protein product, partial [Dicrocoelium dendriticum]